MKEERTVKYLMLAYTNATAWQDAVTGFEPGAPLPPEVTADEGRTGQVHRSDPAAHTAARRSEAVLRRIPAQRAPDAGGVQRGECTVGVLPGFAGPVR